MPPQAPKGPQRFQVARQEGHYAYSGGGHHPQERSSWPLNSRGHFGLKKSDLKTVLAQMVVVLCLSATTTASVRYYGTGNGTGANTVPVLVPVPILVLLNNLH